SHRLAMTRDHLALDRRYKHFIAGRLLLLGPPHPGASVGGGLRDALTRLRLVDVMRAERVKVAAKLLNRAGDLVGGSLFHRDDSVFPIDGGHEGRGAFADAGD